MVMKWSVAKRDQNRNSHYAIISVNKDDGDCDDNGSNNEKIMPMTIMVRILVVMI